MGGNNAQIDRDDQRLAVLAGCSQLDTDAAEDETTETEEAEPEQLMLANGAPAYPGIDISAATVRPPSGESQAVSFETGAAMFDVLNFYREYYEGDDHDISSLSLSAGRGNDDVGGSISISLNGSTGGSRVSISPRDEGGEFDLSKRLGEQIPTYTGVAADAVTVNERDNGRRSVRFETADAPIEVFDFYRTAFEANGLEMRSASLYARSREYRRSTNVSVNSRYNATGSRVYTSVRDPNRPPPEEK